VTGYVLRRLAQALPTLFVVSILLFFGMRAVPGGPLAAFASVPGLSEHARQQIVHQWGLDQPLLAQYLAWLKSMITGHWQYSFFLHKPVNAAILHALPATLLLSGVAFVVQECIVLVCGIHAAVRRYSRFDQGLTVLTYVLYSMPVFWLGLVLILLFGVTLGILPTSGIVNVAVTGAPWGTSAFASWFGQHPLEGLLQVAGHLVLPALTIALVGIAGDVRFLRDSMLEALGQDYVRTARAKGLSERSIVYKHALRNALLPVATNLALTLPALFTGTIVVEQIFSWPGMGQLFFQALNESDYPLMLGIMFVTACLVVLFNVLADLAYAVIDPRISYE
jgi:peptide/nickel transport system permease protein